MSIITLLIMQKIFLCSHVHVRKSVSAWVCSFVCSFSEGIRAEDICIKDGDRTSEVCLH